ncbi:MAG: outer membrane lipoprotein LolB [Halieaceae bacterium]|jgi:outer membrane lipoprotein LolB
MTRLSHLAIAIGSLLLSACAAQPTNAPSTQQSWEQQKTALEALDQWQVQGKMALRTATESQSASMIWSQRDHVTQLRLSGPLGAAATHIYADGKILEINRGGKTDRFDMSSPDTIAAGTGWDLPLRELPRWLLGMPTGDAAVASAVVENNVLRQFTELGWTVRYEQYGSFDGLSLPVHIIIERNESRARLIIRDWTFTRAP